MPSSMTHTYFGLDVYKGLNKVCQNKIKDAMEYYKLFCQGADPFMFYHFLIGKKAKEIGRIQKMMHLTKTREFFLTTIKYIHENRFVNNSEVMSYLYGYICHYFSDLYTHPLIYYKGGLFRRGDKDTYKYNGIHQMIEYGIDLYFIKNRENIDYKKFRVHDNIFNVKNFTPNLKDIIKVTIEDVYMVKSASEIYEESIWYMKKFFKLANYDPYGIKLKLYKMIDKITPDNVINIGELSFSNEYKDIDNWLNLDNNIWYCPWDKSISYKSSFLELYEMATDKSIRTIEEVTKMLDNGKLDYRKLEQLFQDLSFATGISCNTNVEIKYFEF